jgi:KRAB domain-containing zinc finger protein
VLIILPDDPSRPFKHKFYKGHFKCSPCDKKNFADMSSLARHDIVFHSKDLKKKQKLLEREKSRQESLSEKTCCSLCGKSVSKRYIKDHYRRFHEEDGGKKFECDLCGKKQYNKQEMGHHMETNHLVGRQKLQCPECTYSCYLTYFMTSHINSTHLNKGIVCETCGKLIASKHKLQIHTRIWHSGETPYKCKVEGCTQSFASSTRRSEHMASKHSQITVNCPVCQTTFRSNPALRRHMKDSHSEKKFPCTFEGCHYRFSKRGKLLIHLATHTGIKPFPCKHCPHSNASKAGLRRHLRDVHLAWKVSCEICEFSTGRKETLRKHVMSNHRDIGETQYNELLKRIREIPLPKTELDENDEN